MKRTISALIALLMLAFCCAAPGEVAASGNHALYLDESGTVWAWGANHRHESVPWSEDYMQLTPEKVFEGARQIACGRQFSLVLDTDGNVWLWGDNSDGKLIDAGAVISEKTLFSQNVKQIAADDKGCALLFDDGSVSWFDGENVNEYSVNANEVSCGTDFVLMLTEDGEALFAGNGYYVGQSERVREPVSIMSGIKSVAAGGQTAMLIPEDGALCVMGASGYEGRLGLDTAAWISEPTPNGVQDALRGIGGLSANGAITRDGTLYLWGSVYSLFSTFTEDGIPFYVSAEVTLINYGKTPMPVYMNVKSCAIGDAFIVVEMDDGTLLSWGTNDWGQAGDGSYTVFTMSQEEDDDGEEEFDISVSDNRQHVFPVQIIIGGTD